ncbi:MAG: HAMP domain-containing protein [Armatimonadetes bacterium]|nr:HAMP domain-containing protein [Armatimonadota bacterium]
MSVSARLNLATALVFVAAAMAAVAMYFSHLEVVRQSSLLRQSGEIQASLEQLDALTAACTTPDDDTRRKLWLSVHAQARSDLEGFRTDSSYAHALLADIARRHEQLFRLFNGSAEHRSGDASLSPPGRPTPLVTEISSAIVNDGRRLRQHYVTKLLDAEIHAKHVVLGVLLFLMWLNIATVLTVRQSALQPIMDIQRAAEKVAGGDISVRLDNKVRNEAGAAVEAFNRMICAVSEQHHRLSDDFRQALRKNAKRTAEVEAELEETRDQLQTQSALRAQAEQAAALHAQQVETILRVFPEVMYVADTETFELLFVNDRFRNMLAKDPVGGTCFVELHGREDPCEFCTNALLRETGGVCQHEIYNAKLDRHFMATDLLIQWPTGGSFRPALLQVSVDNTWSRAAQGDRQLVIQELERRNKELERFTRTVCHELRGPMVTIAGFASLLEKASHDGCPQDLREDVSRIRQAAEDGANIVDELMHLSSVRNQPLEAADVSLTELVSEILDPLSLDLAQHGIALSVAPDLPDIHIDRGRISYILRNLFGSAIQSVRGRPDPQVEIGWSQSDAGGPVVFVRTNATGMIHAGQDVITDEFDQSGTDVCGTSLGHALAKRVMEDLEGCVWTESRSPSLGVTVTITLPQASLGEQSLVAMGGRHASSQA